MLHWGDKQEPCLALEEVTLAEVLPERVDAFGKWHLSFDKHDPNLQGFAHFAGSLSNLNGTGKGYYDWRRTVDGKTRRGLRYATTVTTDDAMASDAPVRYVAYHAIHAPWENPPGGTAESDVGRALEMLAHLDAQLGRLLAQHSGYVFLISDNGTPQPLGGAKGFLTEGGLNVLFLAAGPGIVPGLATPHVLLVGDGATAFARRCGLSRGSRIGERAACWDVGNHGRGVSARVLNPAELELAFASALRLCPQVVVEKSLSGFDFRVLVIDGALVAASLREPAHVVGDGASSIRQLIDVVNADPRRGAGHERSLTTIEVNDMTERLLTLRGYQVNDVLPAGERLYLKSTANLSSGGTARDVTGEVHQDLRLMCERVARLIGLDCIGIDIVAPGVDTPLDPESGGVVEVNAAPGFRMHIDPSEGQARDVAKTFVEMLFPPERSFKVPIVAVTGTNGKTTTSKLIAHALKYGGAVVGFAGTTGVEIDGVSMVSGDYSGPEGAGMVLREPTIDHAVLEVARGGILRRGLGFDQCHVGILLNVDNDHIGTEGVDDLEELALVKSAVIEVVAETGVAVLNADDPVVVGLASRARGRVIYFSLTNDNAVVRQHLDEGGAAVVVVSGAVVIQSTEPPLHVLPVTEAPITLRGVASFNTANVLAAVAALHGLGVPVDLIRNGVRTFHPSGTQNPGRMNVIDFVTFKVIIDYAHNVPAVRALGSALALLTEGRKIVVAHGTGNRVDASIEEFGAVLASVYDQIIVAEVDPRHRDLGETVELMRTGAMNAGFPGERFEIVMDPLEAIDRAFEVVQTGDLIVIQVDQVEPMLNQVLLHFERLRKAGRG